MARKNFNPAERTAFTAGTVVQWLHGSRWVPALILTTGVKVDTVGCKYMDVEYTGKTTNTISNGAYIMAHPGSIRLPA